MSDKRLRELERHWRETGAVEDEAAYLLERARSGTLTSLDLERAASAGYPAATRACPQAAAVPPDERVAELLREIASEVQDDRILRLWAADCAERRLRDFEARNPGDDCVREAIRVAREFALGRGSTRDLTRAGDRTHVITRREALAARTVPEAGLAATAAVAAHWATHHDARFAANGIVGETVEPWAEFDGAERRFQLERLIARWLHGPTDLPRTQ